MGKKGEEVHTQNQNKSMYQPHPGDATAVSDNLINLLVMRGNHTRKSSLHTHIYTQTHADIQIL